LLILRSHRVWSSITLCPPPVAVKLLQLDLPPLNWWSDTRLTATPKLPFTRLFPCTWSHHG
jgi:hypothetical protein